jgi:uncharacterized protein (DUF2236 family)
MGVVLSFGSPADRVGPVALRPRLATELPFSLIDPSPRAFNSLSAGWAHTLIETKDVAWGVGSGPLTIRRPMTTTEQRDTGYFGPGSMAWHLHTNPALMAGGLRTLLYQGLNPLAMAGVDQHSRYREDPWGRLERTSEYVITTIFGTKAEADAASARLRLIHKRIRGIDPTTGRSYSAEDPELLLWVHATEVDSFLESYRRYGGRLSDQDADRYVREMVKAAELAGIPPHAAPKDTGELGDYLESMRTKLALTPAAREGMRVLLNPPMPLPLKPLWAVLASATVAILPPHVRDLYGLPWFGPADPPLRLSMIAAFRTMSVVLPGHPMVRTALARAEAEARREAA